MNLEAIKGLAAFVLFSCTLFSCTLPICLLRRARHDVGRYRRAISLVSCFGGGVFLGTCFLHLYPEVEEQMDKVLQVLQLQTTFPVSHFLVVSGFLLILVIEQTVQHLQQQSEMLPFLAHNHSHDGTAAVRQPLNYGAVPQGPEQSDIELSVHEDHSSHSRLRTLVLVMALSMHSIFEGFAIGLQSTSESVVRILVAVLIHKSIIAFTLGLNLAHSRLRKSSTVPCILVFAITSPIGTISGMLIMNMGSGISMTIASGVLQGIACGTFVYVTLFEVLRHELNSSSDIICKVFCILLGVLAVVLLVLYVPT